MSAFGLCDDPVLFGYQTLTPRRFFWATGVSDDGTVAAWSPEKDKAAPIPCSLASTASRLLNHKAPGYPEASFFVEFLTASPSEAS